MPVIKIKASDWKNLPPPGQYPGIWSRRNQKGVFVDKDRWLIEQAKLWTRTVEVLPYYNDVSFGNKSQGLADWLGTHHKKTLGMAKVKQVLLTAIEELASKDEQEEGSEVMEEGGPQGDELPDLLSDTPADEDVHMDALEEEEMFDGENRQRRYSESESEGEPSIAQENLSDNNENITSDNPIESEIESDSDGSDTSEESEVEQTGTLENSPDMFADSPELSQKSLSKWTINQENEKILNANSIGEHSYIT